MKIKNETKAMSLKVTDGLTVAIIPNSDHEFLMDGSTVALGYGVSESTIREHKKSNIDEFEHGKHFVSGVRITDSDPHNKVYWTKRGIVRLGFFIRSERAKLFRDWAEDLIIEQMEKPKKSAPQLAENNRPRHNRLTPDRLVDLLADVAMIEDSAIRQSLVTKLTGRV